jgi:iron complex transport system substrate-binding protein
MRIVSLQPSITVTLAGVGALDQLVACTRYCKDLCPEAVSEGRAILEDSWTASTEQILAAGPDVVLASVPYRMESLAEILRAGVRVVAFAPRTLADIFNDIRLLASLCGRGTSGEKLIQSLQEEMEQTRRLTVSRPLQRVYCEEWGKPLIASQRWVAELVEAAAGVFVGAPGAQTTPEAVAATDPEVVIAAWCGAGDRVPLAKVAAREGWEKTAAVREHRVFCISDELLNTPAHTLSMGLRAIRWALHPDLFWRPGGIRCIDDEAPE